MPDGISINTPSFRAPSPQVPDSPVPRAVERMSQTISDQVNYLGDVYLRQKQLTDDKMAINEFYEKHYNLETELSTMKDIDKADDVYATGIQDALKDIREKYPHMSPIAEEKLNRLVAGKFERMQVEKVKRQLKQSHADYNSAIQNFVEQSSKATSFKDISDIEYSGREYIHQSALNGLISMEKANRDMFHLHYLAAKSRYDWVVANNPRLALTIKQDESRVSANDWEAGQSRAWTQLHQKDQQDMYEWNEQRRMLQTNALAGAYNNNLMELESIRTTIGEDIYRRVMSNVPDNETSKHALQDIIDNTPWENPDDLTEFQRNWILGNHTLSSSDHSFLTGQIEQKKKELSDPMHIHKNKLVADLQAHILNVGGKELSLSSSRLLSKQLDNITNHFKAALPEAKNISEQNELFDKYLQQVDKIFEKKKPTITPTPSASEKLLDAYSTIMGQVQ